MKPPPPGPLKLHLSLNSTTRSPHAGSVACVARAWQSREPWPTGSAVRACARVCAYACVTAAAPRGRRGRLCARQRRVGVLRLHRRDGDEPDDVAPPAVHPEVGAGSSVVGPVCAAAAPACRRATPQPVCSEKQEPSTTAKHGNQSQRITTRDATAKSNTTQQLHASTAAAAVAGGLRVRRLCHVCAAGCGCAPQPHGVPGVP